MMEQYCPSDAHGAINCVVPSQAFVQAIPAGVQFLVCVDSDSMATANHTATQLSASVLDAPTLSKSQVSQLKAQLHFASVPCSDISSQVSSIMDGWMPMPLVNKVGPISV